MFAFMCSMGLWKTHFVIGTKASGLLLTKPSGLSQRDQTTTLHTLAVQVLGTNGRASAAEISVLPDEQVP